MSVVQLNPALRQFIARHVHSVEQLEILCLVAEAPSRSWTVEEIFRVIRSSEKSVAACLETFQREGLLKGGASEGWQFAPKTDEMRKQVHELAQTYRQRRVAVVETIYKPYPLRLEDFANAFRIGKEK